MKTRSGLMRLSALLSFLVLLNSCETEKAKEATASKFEVPVTYYTLENGLKVILSEDTTSPTA
ncbi:MAG: hypothetical protein WBM56_05955, partial [Robiginitalea sp.]